MQATATYRGEEIEADFTAVMERSDYGVPRSPVWFEIDPTSIEIDALSILGIEVDPATLPLQLREAIRDLADEAEFVPEPEHA